MAVYDHLYNCDKPLLSGKAFGPNTLDSIFKPQRRNTKSQEKMPKNTQFSKNQEKEYLKRVYLFHTLIVAPLLIYIG